MQRKRKFFRIITLLLIMTILTFVGYGCEPEQEPGCGEFDDPTNTETTTNTSTETESDTTTETETETATETDTDDGSDGEEQCDTYNWPGYEPNLDYDFRDQFADIDPDNFEVFPGCDQDVVAGVK